MKILRSIFWGLLGALILLLLWLVPHSGWFIRPLEAVYHDGHIEVEREFPLKEIFGMPVVRYVEVVRPQSSFDNCQDAPQAPFRYKESASDTRRAGWPIDHWAARCIKGPFQWEARWTVYVLWGLVPIRPVSLRRDFSP